MRKFIRYLFCSMFLVAVFSQCTRNEAFEIDTLVTQIMEISTKDPSGFTIEIPSLEPLDSGYIVSYLATENSFDKEGLKRVVIHALDHDKIVGGWLNSDDNLYYFDSNALFFNKEEAINFAIEQKQMGIYDLANKELIIIDPK